MSNTKTIRTVTFHTISIYQTILPMTCRFLGFYMHLQKAQKEKHWKNGSFLHLELCILQDSTSTLRIFNNILSYVTSIPLSTIFILRICPSFCLISVGSINFSLLDNGLCSKRRYFQFASKCLFFMLFTCLSLYCGTTRSKKIFLITYLVADHFLRNFYIIDSLCECNFCILLLYFHASTVCYNTHFAPTR